MAEQVITETLVEKEVTPKDERVRKGGIVGSVWNLCNGILGSGILVLPMAVSKFGWLLGSLFLGLFALVSAITCYLLSQIFYYTGSDTYAGMGEGLYGRWARITINVIQVLYGFGALFSYTIVAADESHYAMENFIGDIATPGTFLYWFVDRSRLLIILTICVILPPTLLPHMNNLKYTSFLSICTVFFLLIALGIKMPHTGACTLSDTASFICKSAECVIENDPRKYIYSNLTSCLEQCEHCTSPTGLAHTFSPIHYAAGAFFSLPFFCFSSTCQVQFVPILAEMKEPSKKNVLKVLTYSFLMIFVVYVIASVSGYYSFCGYTTNNILDSFPIHDVLILLCRIAIVINMCFSVPLFSHPLRSMILDLMNVKEVKYWMIACITLVIVTLDTIIAIVFKDLGTVLGITGAIGSSTIMMILPSLMYMSYLKQSGKGNCGKWFMAILILCMGLVFGTLGTIATIQQS